MTRIHETRYQRHRGLEFADENGRIPKATAEPVFVRPLLNRLRSGRNGTFSGRTPATSCGTQPFEPGAGDMFPSFVPERPSSGSFRVMERDLDE